MSGLPLTFTALAVTLFLFPGVAYLAGLYSSPSVNRDTSSLSAPAALALVLFAAILSNLAIGILYWLNFCALGSGRFCGPFEMALVAGLTLGDYVFLGVASIVLSAVAFRLGNLTVRLIESGAWHTEFLHGWAYEYVRDPGPKTAFIVTAIEYDGKRLGYEGSLHSLRLGSDGIIKTVRLKGVSRFRLDVVGLAGSRRERLDAPEDDTWQDTDLVIEGSRIENIAIRPLPSFAVFREDDDAS